MKNISVVGVDISKRNFEICEMSRGGKVLGRKRLYRADVIRYFSRFQRCTVVMESCGGAHHWGRELKRLGHEVKLIAPQFVKPFVKSNKSDRADAEAIAEAGLRPEMRFVEIKSIAQQELQHLHRIRERVIKARVAASNELRGMMLEYGVAIAQGKRALEALPELIHRSPLSEFGKELALEVWDEINVLDKRQAGLDSRIEKLSAAHPVCKRLETIPGVGPVIATAMVAAVGNAAQFKNGRQFAASLGLVPRHSGTGGKTRLLGISKRGDGYLRRQLIHGARSVLYVAHKKSDRLSRWATKLKISRGWNRAAVALANKNARVIWALMRYQQDYSVA